MVEAKNDSISSSAVRADRDQSSVGRRIGNYLGTVLASAAFGYVMQKMGCDAWVIALVLAATLLKV